MPTTATIPSQIRVGDIGTELLTRILDADDSFTHDDDGDDARAVDLTGATLTLTAEKPDGTVVEWVATGGSLKFPARTAARGWMRYLTLAGDLDLDGHWRVQPTIVIGAGTWRAEIHDILVYPNL